MLFAEILAVIAAIVGIYYLLRKRNAYSPPSTLSNAALFRRIEAHRAWMLKHQSLPEGRRQTERIRRLYGVKRRYFKRLKNELAMRQMAAVVQAFHPDASSIARRIDELMAEGQPKRLAQSMAQLEWGLTLLLASHLKGEVLHDQGDTASVVLYAADLVKTGISESAAIMLALKAWSEDTR
jgi:hypothetical protein